MQWLNIHTSTLDSEAFLCSEPDAQATWLKLFRYCAGQENGGVIHGARDWPDRQWQQLVRATRKEVRRKSQLWEWIEGDLKVKFYPIDKEREVQAKRSAAVSTHSKIRILRGAHQQSAEQRAEQPEKGMERKRSEREGNHPPSNRPTVEEAIEHFVGTGGDYTAREVRDVWNSFEATIQNGTWFFGRRPVGDWRSAMATRLSDNQKKVAPANDANSRLAGWQEGDQDSWWTEDLASMEAAAAGAWIGKDDKKAARMDAIIALRKGRR